MSTEPDHARNVKPHRVNRNECTDIVRAVQLHDDPGPASRWFFMHIPKTGGSTLNVHIRNNFSDDTIWAAHEPQLRPLSASVLYTNVARLAAMSEASREQTRFFRGHFPFSAVTLLGDDVRTLTVLREPVARTVSWLNHCRRNNPEHHDLTLEAIYEDDWFTVRYARNLQTKQFGMTLVEAQAPMADVPGDRVARSIYVSLGCALNAAVEVDDSRFEAARAAMTRIDVLGVTERYEDLCARLARDYGWTMRRVPSENVGAPHNVSNALRRRIEADNRYDTELYVCALDLLDQS